MTIGPARVETIVEKACKDSKPKAREIVSSRRGSGSRFRHRREAAPQRGSVHELGGWARSTKQVIAAVRRAIEEAARSWRVFVQETVWTIEDKIRKNLLVGRKTPGTEILAPSAVSGDHGLTLEERAPYGVTFRSLRRRILPRRLIKTASACWHGGNATVFAPHPGQRAALCEPITILEEAVLCRRAGPKSHPIASPRSNRAGADAPRRGSLIVVTAGPAS